MRIWCPNPRKLSRLTSVVGFSPSCNAPVMATVLPWRQLLLESLQANKHLITSQYFQLATVNKNGRPANRTVVFRGFIEGTEKLQFTTHALSQKVQEIKEQAYGEACWYFTESREQFRISGILAVIGYEDPNPQRLKIRERAWFQSSVNSREQFLDPPPDGATPHLDPSDGPVQNFCVVTLEPQEIDYLHLRTNKRHVFEKTGEFSWIQHEVDPWLKVTL